MVQSILAPNGKSRHIIEAGQRKVLANPSYAETGPITVQFTFPAGYAVLLSLNK